jgi:hypothetical protein
MIEIRPNNSWYLMMPPSLSLTFLLSAEVVVGSGIDTGCECRCWISEWRSAALTPLVGFAKGNKYKQMAGVPCWENRKKAARHSALKIAAMPLSRMSGDVRKGKLVNSLASTSAQATECCRHGEKHRFCWRYWMPAN